ncbi:unnamed protein product [Pylaiella littoralis]
MWGTAVVTDVRTYRGRYLVGGKIAEAQQAYRYKERQAKRARRRPRNAEVRRQLEKEEEAERNKSFLACLEKNDRDHLPCKSLSKRYLACRMDRNLMAKEEFEKLGFTSEEEYQRIRSQAPVKEGKKEGEGFVGGTHIRQRGGGWLSSWKKKD